VNEAEQLARVAYGRLLAILAAGDGDIVWAEECLAEAFAKALTTWPETGAPRNPEAWLLTVARNARHDRRRSAEHRLTDALSVAPDDDALAVWPDVDVDAIPDRRLALLFVCAHPGIDAAVRTPLMLQVVLGFDAEQIARAFAMPTATMAQRLVRAKRRIRDARIPFVIPEQAQMTARLTPVLEAIYGAYAIDFPLVAGTQPRESLADEALYLATTLAELLPREAEALALAALIALSLARREARRTHDRFIPLEQQDTSQWDTSLIATGERYLHAAQALGTVGRFQLEAAIQSVHCARATSGRTDWQALRTLHRALVELAPTLGARVAYAAAVGRVDGAQAGLDALDVITDSAVHRFQPAWATRAHLLADAGHHAMAAEAGKRALSLTTDLQARTYLAERVTAWRDAARIALAPAIAQVAVPEDARGD
jgi:RNA polymerase sigma-70 factor (ECF subfamily)